MKNRIPKTIHYCWFGGQPIPNSAKRCIESWKKFCPDYDIIEWNESNYDYQSSTYALEAYRAHKWAFVSDYARFDILYRHGGIYFDIDVELIRPIDDIVEDGPFIGCEKATEANGKNVAIGINPGLGLGAFKGQKIYKTILDSYNADSFTKTGTSTTVVKRVTDIFSKCGFSGQDEKQLIEDVLVYPSEYFCPLDNMTGKMYITEKTKSIHHYDASWMNTSGKISIGLSRKFSNTGMVGHMMGVILSIPFRLVNKLRG